MRMLAFLLPVVLMACSDAGAQGGSTSAEPQRIMTVSGEGQSFGTPDMAMMQFGVISEGKTAGEAMEANAVAMTSVRDRLKRLGIASKDMQTANFSLNPIYPPYNRNNNEDRKIIGYTANNTLSVRLRDIDKVGATIDAAVVAGANNLNGLQFGFQDQTDLEEEAKRAAVREARQTAEILADEAGIELGKVMTISVSGYRSSPRPVTMARLESSDVSTPVEAGESSLSATVSMTFEIK